MGDRYVAYVGSYTHESSKGLYLFDMDVEKGRISKKQSHVLPVVSFHVGSKHERE